jgi:signal transduction histidine kinase
VAVRFEPKAARKGIALDFDIQAGLPPVPADLRRFDQILGRILDNAVRFTPENGRIVVTAQALPSWPFTTGERPALRVTVTDNGPGIRPEDCERIFEPFVQLEDSYLLHSEGAGLGLTLARRLAVAHGGAVTAECRGVGNGSTLTLLLPLSRQTELA